MMNIPVEIITYYNTKISVTKSSVYRVTSDVIRVEMFWLNDTWVLLEGLKDKWDITLHYASHFEGSWCSLSGDLMCLKHLVSSAKAEPCSNR